MRRSVQIAAGLALLGVWGCEEVEVAIDARRDLTPHEAYVRGLHDAGLAGTALTQDWLREASRALQEPLAMQAPFVEEGYFTPEDPMAIGYRFELERGQTATVSLAVDSEVGGQVFFDLLRVAEDPDGPPRPVRADTTDLGFVYEPTRDGEFVVRVQPELLRGGAYRLSVELDPALAFPVYGRSMSAALSLWGAPRDGGRRRHEGIDIFARRGTPVVASVAGRVTRANTTPIGGKVVWLRDDRQRRSIYYAHLDTQAVERGDRVEIGDTLGTVGNTGNAITTPPHLHFGIYYRGEGAVDPAPFVRPVGRSAAEFAVDREAWGEWVRIADEGIRLRTGPSRRAEVASELDRWTPARVLGGSGDWYRVRLPDGRSGYVAARLTESIEAPVDTWVGDRSTDVVAGPTPDSPRMSRLAVGDEAEILGTWGDFHLIRADLPALGWIRSPSVATDRDR